MPSADRATRVIAAEAPLVTLITVVTVAPALQAARLALRQRTTAEVMRHLPAVVAATLHRDVDGTSAAIDAHCASRAACDAMREQPAAQVHGREAAAEAHAPPVLDTAASVPPAWVSPGAAVRVGAPVRGTCVVARRCPPARRHPRHATCAPRGAPSCACPRWSVHVLGQRMGAHRGCPPHVRRPTAL